MVTARGCDSASMSFGASCLCFSMFFSPWRCGARDEEELGGALKDLSEDYEMDPMFLPERAMGSKQQKQESHL